jgi:hypothetical protein
VATECFPAVRFDRDAPFASIIPAMPNASVLAILLELREFPHFTELMHVPVLSFGNAVTNETG